jgi:hypothetical protein
MLNPDSRGHFGIPKEKMDEFLKVSLAFKTIRDQRLYREAFPSFDAYCQAKCGKSGAEIEWLIAEADVEVQMRKGIPGLQ